MCFAPQRRALFEPKVLRTWQFLAVLTSKCASRHNAAHFSNISTSKSSPDLRDLHILTWTCASCHNAVHFLNILTSRKWFEHVGFLHFDVETRFVPQSCALFPHLNCSACSLQNLPRATTARIFSFLISPDGSAPAALASPLFDHPEPQIVGKTQCFATFLPFCTPASTFFWLFLFSDLLSSSFLFSDSSHLCFSIRPYCRKFDF